MQIEAVIDFGEDHISPLKVRLDPSEIRGDDCVSLVTLKRVGGDGISLSWDELRDILVIVKAGGWEPFNV